MENVTITVTEYKKMVRANIAARMAINLLIKCKESGFLRQDELEMLLNEFGADCQ